MAGLKVERLINEPSAAALAYQTAQNKEEAVLPLKRSSRFTSMCQSSLFCRLPYKNLVLHYTNYTWGQHTAHSRKYCN